MLMVACLLMTSGDSGVSLETSRDFRSCHQRNSLSVARRQQRHASECRWQLGISTYLLAEATALDLGHGPSLLLLLCLLGWPIMWPGSHHHHHDAHFAAANGKGPQLGV